MREKSALFSTLIVLASILPCPAAEDAPKTSFTQLVEEAHKSGSPVPTPPALGPGVPAQSKDQPVLLFKRSGASGSRGGSTIMLQGFHWESHQSSWWSLLESKAGEIGSAGFDIIWLPPSSDAGSTEGYLPRRLYVQDSAYGSMQALKSAIRALHSAGVKVIADIVVNHRVGTNGWADFTDPPWGQDAVTSDDECVDAKQCSGHSNNPDSGLSYGAGRDIDHANPNVQASIVQWMNWLKKEIGYDGWRWDFARGFDAKILAAYNDAAPPAFAVAEIWDGLDVNNPDPHRQALCDWINSAGGKVSAFDFTTKGVLQQAVYNGEYWRLKDSQGKPSGLIGWWPAKAVTFVDNHDTGASTGGSGQNHWPFPSQEIMQGYAYILTHPGVPCVYWPHYFDWGVGDQISSLMRLRRTAGIGEGSTVAIQAAEQGRYAAIVDGRLAVKIGWGDWSPGAGWALSASGRNYAVWLKG